MNSQEYSAIRRRWIIGDILCAVGVGLVGGMIVADGRLGFWSIAVIAVLTAAVFLPRGIGWKREREKLNGRPQRPNTGS
ncbi:hypothetical protein [Arthrobacter globiformis]|uniref:hypothetical protein n=1 Tax=Arthrobacter globiformis TaxID=1665 RepID=UPI002780EB46|nr:hypothetical protein [Arthrobacter globiformis]MDQ0867424.1 hypothetical protein [Arthrobacter globiformis]